MTTLRIRGLYAVALTQLFRQHPDTWQIVQPDETVQSLLPEVSSMVSPEVDIDDEPDEHGYREIIRLSGSAEAVEAALEALRQHCFDVTAQMENVQVGAIYNGLVGINSRARRCAVVYLGPDLVGELPLRYEDRDLRVGTVIPVRIETVPNDAGERPTLSNSLTVAGRYAVLTSAPAVRLSKQITETNQRERLQRLGEVQETGGWGIVWRTAAQHTDDATLVAEIQHLAQETAALQDDLRARTGVGYVRGGEVVAHAYLPGHAKTVCDELRSQLCPTLPGHHKYKAIGDIYSTTVDALEKELSPDELRARSMPLNILASIDAMQQTLQSQLRLRVRDLQGVLHEQGVVEKTGDDLQTGWVEVREALRSKDAYPRHFRIDKKPGDYTATRFQEGAWHYWTRFFNRDGHWTGTYAACTTPVAIFADQIHVLDLGVTVTHSTRQEPQIRGLDTLKQAQAQRLVSAALVAKIQDEAEAVLHQMLQEEPPPTE
jgi:hypothetical protein